MLGFMSANEKHDLVSIVICSHSLENYLNLKDALDSLLGQTYKPIEIIVVIDNNQKLADNVSTTYTSEDNVSIIVTEQNLGVAQARNVGIRAARGDIVAFFDDDAIACREWVASLMNTYQELDALAVGGKILPIWLSSKPDYLPEELYWLVGVTHEGFAEERITEVRDTFGPNMSFRRQVFDEVGFFNESLGFANKGTSYVQGEEAEFALRMKSKLGKGVIYNPRAIVYHKIPAQKLRFSLLLKRSLFQGYSKALLQRLVPSSQSLSTERSYLKDLVFKYIPGRMKKLFSGAKALTEAKQLSFLLLSVLAVGLGFIYGYVR